MNWNLAIFVASFAMLVNCAADRAIAQTKPATTPNRSIDPATAGRILLGDLNCTACHAASESQTKWLSPKIAPRLNDLGNRVSPGWITKYLAAPQEMIPGGTMPDLLAHLPASDRTTAADEITHYLLSVSAPKARPAFVDRAAVARGEALYHTVGCVACHAPQNGVAQPAGSQLLPVMHEKWTFDGLRRFLRDPLAVRPSGRMPSMNLTDAESADIAHYLLRDTRVPAAVEVTQFRGRFRSLEDFDSAELGRTFPAGGLTLEMMGRDRGYSLRFTSFLQIERAGEYTFYLAAAGSSRLAIDGKWLLGEESWRSEKVDGKTAVTLTAGLHEITLDFVQRGQREPSLKVEWDGPGIVRQQIPAEQLQSRRERAPDPAAFTVDAAKAARGKALYASMNCATCHEQKPHANPPPSLAALDPTRGCLSAKADGAVRFRFESDKIAAIRMALQRIGRPELADPGPQDRLALSLGAMRCSACHVRDGIGGVPPDRDAFFTSTGEDLGDEGRIPPRLDGVGNKLRPTAIAAALHGGVAVRPYLGTRMPQFGQANTDHLPELFVAIDRKPLPIKPSPDPADVQRDVGRKLVGTDGLSCIACHRFNRQPGQTMQVVDLTTAAERLNEDWFRQFAIDPNRFHPGTRMPSFWPEGKSLLPALLGGDTDRQLAALWTYLADGGRAKFPEGLSRQNVELVVGGEAVVYRGKLWEAGFRAVAVGYPGQLNMAFDAEEMRLSLLWRGRFLNAGPHWGVQGMGQIRPLGTDVVVFPKGSPLAILNDAASPWPAEPGKSLGMKFGGYQLDKLKQPSLLYSFAGAAIEDLTTPIESGGKVGLRRTITFVDPPAEKLHLRVAVGTIKSLGDGTWRLNDALTITIQGGGGPVVRGSGDQQELIVPVRLADKTRRLEVDYAW